MSDPLGSIEIKEEPSYGEQVVKNIPLAGDLASNAMSAAKDGDITGSEMTGLMTDGADFISSCSELASDMATDPIGALVGQGLGFLLAICQPLQDALHMVTGDGPALSVASENFANIGQGIADFADQLAEESASALASWEGQAAEAAATTFEEFTNGVRAVAGEAGNIAELLQVSSMIMTVIEEFIMALLTELITWLIMIWIPALAAAVYTFGASTAAAGTATGVRAAQSSTQVTKKVNWLQKLLNKIKEVLTKMKTWMSKQGRTFREVMDNKQTRVSEATKSVNDAMASGGRGSWSDRLHHEETGMIGERVNQGFKKQMGSTAQEWAKDQVSVDGIEGTVSDYNKAQERDEIGEEQWTMKTTQQLRF